MGVFKELDPEIAKRIIQGYEDELTPEYKKQEAFYRQFDCPRCKLGLQKEINTKTAFDSESLIPKANLRCPHCNFLLAPHSGIVLDVGEAPEAMFEIDSTLRR